MYERNMVSTKTTKKKVSSSKPSSSASCKYKKVGETKDSAHKCVYVKTGSGTGSGSDKNSKYYTASIVDGKRKYRVYNGEVKRVQKGGVYSRRVPVCMGSNCINVVHPTKIKKINQASYTPQIYYDHVYDEDKQNKLSETLEKNLKNDKKFLTWQNNSAIQRPTLPRSQWGKWNNFRNTQNKEKYISVDNNDNDVVFKKYKSRDELMNLNDKQLLEEYRSAARANQGASENVMKKYLDIIDEIRKLKKTSQ